MSKTRAARTAPRCPVPPHRSAPTSSTTSRATGPTRRHWSCRSTSAALIGLRLFQLPLRTARATRSLIDTGELCADMTEPTAANPLEQYVDFTGEKGSPSDLVARACVQRDLQATLQFFWDRLYLLSMRNAPAMSAVFSDAETNPADNSLTSSHGQTARRS